MRLLLLTLLAGCCRQLPQVSVPPPVIPELPAEARQRPAQQLCIPSCLENLNTWQKGWQKKLTEPEVQVPLAK